MQCVSREDLEWYPDGHGVICLAGEPFTRQPTSTGPGGPVGLPAPDYRAGGGRM